MFNVTVDPFANENKYSPLYQHLHLDLFLNHYDGNVYKLTN
jgi:hypothetical protein